MDEVLDLKFHQRGNLRELFLGTYAAELVSGESRDLFWGDGTLRVGIERVWQVARAHA